VSWKVVPNPIFFLWLSALNELFFIYMWENGFTLGGCYGSWQGSHAHVTCFCVSLALY